MPLTASRRRQLARAFSGGNKTTAALEAIFEEYNAVTPVKTAAYTANYGEIIPVNTTAAGVTITLPAPVAGSEAIVVKLLSGANAMIVARHAGEEIDGVAANLSTTVDGTIYRLVTDGTNWYTI